MVLEVEFIEIMAMSIPIVTSEEAVAGMDMTLEQKE